MLRLTRRLQCSNHAAPEHVVHTLKQHLRAPPAPHLFCTSWDAIIMLGSQVHPRDTGVEATSLAHRIKLATFGACSTCRRVNRCSSGSSHAASFLVVAAFLYDIVPCKLRVMYSDP